MRWRRLPPGHFALDLGANEREILGWLLPQLREQLLGVAPTGATDPLLRRLFPTAHPDDADAEADFVSAHRDRLLAGRLDALDTVEATLSETVVDEETITAWMHVVNDLRLVLGTRLDVSEDDGPLDLDDSDPDDQARAIYELLGWVLERIVRAQS